MFCRGGDCPGNNAASNWKGRNRNEQHLFESVKGNSGKRLGIQWGLLMMEEIPKIRVLQLEDEWGKGNVEQYRT